MRLTKATLSLALLCAVSTAFADAGCEAKAKTRDDFLACTYADIKSILSDAEKLYQNIRADLKDEALSELEQNHEIWEKKLESDCKLYGFAFNDWGGSYMPDTDFQVAACRKDIARQKLEFYEWLSCPGDMESSKKPKCSTIKRVLGHEAP
jgi:hypothetical protein